MKKNIWMLTSLFLIMSAFLTHDALGKSAPIPRIFAYVNGSQANTTIHNCTMNFSYSNIGGMGGCNLKLIDITVNPITCGAVCPNTCGLICTYPTVLNYASGATALSVNYDAGSGVSVESSSTGSTMPSPVQLISGHTYLLICCIGTGPTSSNCVTFLYDGDCVCKPCKDKRTIFGSPTSPPVTTYQNSGAVTVSSTVSHMTLPVVKVSAEIVDVERLGESGCLHCTKDSKEAGNYTGGILNTVPGHIVNGGKGYGKQIQWQYNTPVLINNFSYTLNMMFPPISEVSCCKDSFRVCTRWSFTDKNCITCDTLVCSVIKRVYTPGSIIHPDTIAPVIQGPLLPDRCCIGFWKHVIATPTIVGNASTGYYTIRFNPTFDVGPRPIKQIRISVVNFESSSTNQECLSCETSVSRLGAMSVPQNLFPVGSGKDPIEGMTYPTNPMIVTCPTCPPLWNSLPSSEVTWGGLTGPGYDLSDGVGDQSTTFSVTLPKESSLNCCDDTIKICIKYSFTNVDCKTCDTIICYKVIKRSSISTYPSVGMLQIPTNNTGTEFEDRIIRFAGIKATTETLPIEE